VIKVNWNEYQSAPAMAKIITEKYHSMRSIHKVDFEGVINLSKAKTTPTPAATPAKAKETQAKTAEFNTPTTAAV
jgi:hypothetical protein